ncbi:hypothetical protein [Bacillus sp. B1-b2]|uniref:hypothetical protein n=1 Tax=Bacillus sp. B1-b2 TaxID=2653201 RepID=UPI00126246CD|nr:hypothetical protein [Bacillus sp. B1-b2]KAB7671675.1 hypothetical protein F9279_04965 [Bacillus sp. B1-b2]
MGALGIILLLIGVFGLVFFAITGIISTIKKDGASKKKFKFAGGSFALVIVGFIVIGSSSDPDDTVKTTSAEEPSTVQTEMTEEEKTSSEAEDKQKAEEANAKAEENAKQRYALMAQLYLPALTDKVVELSDRGFNFIVGNYNLFPAISQEDIDKAKSITDTTISSKHLNKNVDPYLETMTTFEGSVVSIEESTQDDETITIIHLIDDDFQSYQLLLFKSAGEVFEDDVVRFWGLPVGASSFENVSGGTTNVQVFLGSHVEKL